MSHNKSKNKEKIKISKVIVTSAVVISIIAAIGVLGYFSRQIIQWGQIQVAKYELKDDKLNDAIALYRYAIVTYRYNESAYIELADLYERVGSPYDITTLEIGYKYTQSPVIKERLDKLDKEGVVDNTETTVTENEEQKSEYLLETLTETDSKGNVSVLSYSYDDKGLLTEIEETNGQGEFVGRNEYSYDEEGKLTENREYKLRCNLTYKYDENGVLIEEDCKNFENDYTNNQFSVLPNGLIEASNDNSYHIVYELNEDGNIVNSLLNMGEKEYSIDQKYDKNGRVTEQQNDDTTVKISYDDNGNISHYEVVKDIIKTDISYLYDDNNNLLEEEEMTSLKDGKNWVENNTVSSICVYDAGNNRIADIFYQDGKFVYSMKKDYENKKLVKNVVYYEGNDDASYSIDYTYDENGREIQNVETYNSLNKKITNTKTYNDEGFCQSILTTYDGENIEDERDSYVVFTYENGRIVDEKDYFIVSNTALTDKIENINENTYTVWNSNYDTNNAKINTVFEKYENGQVVNRTTINCDNNEMESSVLYYYDDDNRLIEEVDYDKYAKISKHYEYEYDENGNLKEVYLIPNGGGEKYGVQFNTYRDFDGLYLLVRQSDGYSNVSNFTYDTNNNLIKEEKYTKMKTLDGVIEYSYIKNEFDE